MAGESYAINTLSDLVKIPPDRLSACLRDLEYMIQLVHFAEVAGDETDALTDFVWTDDGNHNCTLTDEKGDAIFLLVSEAVSNE